METTAAKRTEPYVAIGGTLPCKYDTVALSGPRGLGKTFLAVYVLARAMTPGDKLHQPGKEYILGAASLE